MKAVLGACCAMTVLFAGCATMDEPQWKDNFDPAGGWKCQPSAPMHAKLSTHVCYLPANGNGRSFPSRIDREEFVKFSGVSGCAEVKVVADQPYKPTGDSEVSWRRVLVNCLN